MKQPVLYQRLEAAFVFIACILAYQWLHFGLWWFVILLFTVDIFMVGYLVNKKVGAHIYTIGHSLFIPATLLVVGLYSHSMLLIAGATIWTAHIGWDRAAGYGLKFASGFQDTHLGRIGKSHE